MKSIRTKGIVIDASIAKSAGGLDAQNPRSASCRKFLEAILVICHKAVFTSEISEEWKRHQSKFSSKWRRIMYARKKVIALKDADLIKLSESAYRKLKHCENSEAILKDIPLIEAALSSDVIVASLDEKARRLLRDQKVHIAELRRVLWVNPCEEDENVIQWLTDGAQSEVAKLL